MSEAEVREALGVDSKPQTLKSCDSERSEEFIRSHRMPRSKPWILHFVQDDESK